MFPSSTYRNRRQKLKSLTGSGFILLPANENVGMNYRDNVYPFRQDSTFLYYTGINLPGVVLIIDIDNDEEILFGDEQTMDAIVWTGPKKPLADYAANSAITNIQPLHAVGESINRRLQQKQPVHFLPPYRPGTAWQLVEWLGISYPLLNEHSSLQLIKAIIAQRSYKTAEEVAQLNLAVDITAAMHRTAILVSRPGITEYEVAAELEAAATASGVALSFPPILTVNGQYLHNHVGRTLLKEGNLVLCDCGAESPMHYAGDMTRTFPVGKKFTTLQNEVYDIVLNAQQTAVAALKPGIPFLDIHLLACEKLAEGLQELGMLKGDIKEAVQLGVHTLFFQCGLGHMMGLDVHDMENLGEQYVGYTDSIVKSKEFGLKSLRLGKELEEGFVLTVEPGIYVIPELIDQWKADRKHESFINYDKVMGFKNFGGIRIEEDFLITATGSQLLGKPFPKTAAEIESLKQSAF